MCHHCLICKAGQCGCFTFLIFRQALFIKIQMKCHSPQHCVRRGHMPRVSRRTQDPHDLPSLVSSFPLLNNTKSTSLGHMTVNLNNSREGSLIQGRSALAPHVRVKAEAGDGVVLSCGQKLRPEFVSKSYSQLIPSIVGTREFENHSFSTSSLPQHGVLFSHGSCSSKAR